jgi:hypothetical protein
VPGPTLPPKLVVVTVQPESHHEPVGQPRRETREELLTWAEPFPAFAEVAIDDLTDEERNKFLATIAAL